MNYQFFKQNSEGRDFICGDVHGYFNILEMQLKKQAFNPAIDRVFSVGDLIDRGRGSADVLEWLEKPWFHAIQGNHERMLIKVVETKSKELRQQWNNWGGIWARSLDYPALQVFYDKIINMPAAIEVEIANGQSVGLVHAELPDQCDWLEVKTMLLKASDKNNIEDNPAISDLFWKRAQPFFDDIKKQQVEPVKNIFHVFHGHTPIKTYTSIANRTFLDLGSYKTGLIGLIDIQDFLFN